MHFELSNHRHPRGLAALQSVIPHPEFEKPSAKQPIKVLALVARLAVRLAGFGTGSQRRRRLIRLKQTERIFGEGESKTHDQGGFCGSGTARARRAFQSSRVPLGWQRSNAAQAAAASS